MDTEKYLCTQGNGCVNTTLFDWCTHRFCALIHGFLAQGCVKSSFLVENQSYFLNKNMFVVFFDIKSKVCTIIFYTMEKSDIVNFYTPKLGKRQMYTDGVKN